MRAVAVPEKKPLGRERRMIQQNMKQIDAAKYTGHVREK